VLRCEASGNHARSDGFQELFNFAVKAGITSARTAAKRLIQISSNQAQLLDQTQPEKMRLERPTNAFFA
jgi:hypothetical protein